ncbi:hypothetical protein HW115_09095 [Verrucomicrobiaceae bacterium N1E253]|uniref:Uncharacterized protein n=1 Tax=Oceaniferula marina TaxID=2748318 RepID=A0A851GKR3_9BACT|nr:glycoside hydrolase family protein [Oceaniferula marina]NWK55765.1 hypothetical protein [Oceaniferula marina]
MKTTSAILLCSLLYSCAVNAQDTQRSRPKQWEQLVPGARFMDRFLPNPVRGKLSSDTWGVDAVKPRDTQLGIEDPAWSYWGGNIRHVDGTYHLFVCRWPENHPKGHMAWHGSTVVRATAPHPWGPYQVAEEIGKGHNPEIFPTKDGSYALYVINGYYHAPDMSGPWTRKKFTFNTRDRRVIEGYTNMSFAPREDGSVLMVCRGGGIWISEDGLSPYQQISVKRAYPPVPGNFEDPVIWKTNIQYHMIVNDWKGRIAYHLRSKDGLSWVTEDGEAYLPGIDRYEDGTHVDWYKYERIKVLQDDLGRAYQANFAVIDFSKWKDKANDQHSSKNIPIPLTVGRQLSILNPETIDAGTSKIQLKIHAEEGFDPHQDMDLPSLRFGPSAEVNYGRGGKVIASEKDGKDLIVSIDASNHAFNSEHFAGKLLGKTKQGKLLFGYSRLPGVQYAAPMLSSRLPTVKQADKGQSLRVETTNYGLNRSPQQQAKIEISNGTFKESLKMSLPELQPYESVTLEIPLPQSLKPKETHQINIMVETQSTPLFTSQHRNPKLIAP